MPTPTGTISFNDLRTETGLTGAISLGDGKVQDLIGRTSGVDMNTARGKTSSFQFNIPVGEPLYFNITTMAYDAGWEGTGDIVAVAPYGYTIGTIVTGSNPWGNITLLVNGVIMGSGGNGGRGLSAVTNSGAFNTTLDVSYITGGSGGDGLVVNTPSTNRVQRLFILNNTGGIYGGGGGGGGGDAIAAGYGAGDVDLVAGGGGGGGGGNPGGTGGTGGIASVINGAGTAVNGYGGNPANQQDPGAGGPPGAHPRFSWFVGGTGGTGGNLGAGGAAGGANTVNWGYQGLGGAAGYAIRGYSNLTLAGLGGLGTTLGTLG